MMLCPSLSIMVIWIKSTPMLNNSRLIIEDSRKCRLPRHGDFPLTKWNGQRTTENPAKLKLGARCKLTRKNSLRPDGTTALQKWEKFGGWPQEDRNQGSGTALVSLLHEATNCQSVRIRWFMIMLSPHSFCRNSMRHIPAQPAFRERHHGLLPQDSNDGPMGMSQKSGDRRRNNDKMGTSF